MAKPKVAFICVHNSCRSQIAEALAKRLASDAFDSYSAGTEPAEHVNPDAVRLLRQLYGIDLNGSRQRPKLITEIPAVDVVVTMGCNVECPYVPARIREDWGLEDPTGKGDEAFKKVMSAIEKKVLELRDRLKAGYA